MNTIAQQIADEANSYTDPIDYANKEAAKLCSSFEYDVKSLSRIFQFKDGSSLILSMFIHVEQP